jgi:hypothetical protein
LAQKAFAAARASSDVRAESLVLDQPRRLAVQDVVCTFVADHDRGCLGVSADQRRHDGGVDDTQTVEAADPELLVYHGQVQLMGHSDGLRWAVPLW